MKNGKKKKKKEKKNDEIPGKKRFLNDMRDHVVNQPLESISCWLVDYRARGIN